MAHAFASGIRNWAQDSVCLVVVGCSCLDWLQVWVYRFRRPTAAAAHLGYHPALAAESCGLRAALLFRLGRGSAVVDAQGKDVSVSGSGIVASSASLGSRRDPATGAHPDANDVVEVQVPNLELFTAHSNSPLPSLTLSLSLSLCPPARCKLNPCEKVLLATTCRAVSPPSGTPGAHWGRTQGG